MAKTALDAYAYRVGKYIGAYTAAMNGVDVICFTAGAGENNAEVRALIGQYIGFLGTNIDPEKNKVRGEEIILSDEGSKVVTMVVPTDEEMAIARETVRLVKQVNLQLKIEKAQIGKQHENSSSGRRKIYY